MALPKVEKVQTSSIEDPKQLIQAELDDTTRALKEITLMLEQSRVELGKLTQRNTAVNAHLQQIHDQIDKLPSEEVRTVYDSALDAQQRLFQMRGQLEKLQSDQTHLEHYKGMLDRLKGATSTGGMGGAGKGEKSGMAGVEMLVNAQESERQRLSRQMHDGPAQALSNFILQTEIAMRLLDVDPAQARNELSNLKVAAMSTFQKVRYFIFELRPMMLDDLGLAPTIRRYADTFKEQAGVEVSVIISGNERRLEPYVGETAIRLSLDDNGNCFDTDSLEKESNLSLKLIKDRAEMMGGKFDVDTAPGKGARVTLTIPVHG